VAFRASFEALSGGISGLFLTPGDSTLRSYLRIGEGGGPDVEGRITSFNQNVSLNASDQVALLATVGGAKEDRQSAIFLAAPASLSVSNLVIKRGRGSLSAKASGKPRDGVRFSAVLRPGNLPKSIDTQKSRLVRQLVSVAGAHTQGTPVPALLAPA